MATMVLKVYKETLDHKDADGNDGAQGPQGNMATRC